MHLELQPKSSDQLDANTHPGAYHGQCDFSSLDGATQASVAEGGALVCVSSLVF